MSNRLVHSVSGRLPKLRRGEPDQVPAVRVSAARRSRAGTAAAGGAQDRHDRLLRPEGLDRRSASGSTPEALREVMTRYFEAMAAALERHGGTIEKYIGDAVMAVFGLPRAARGRRAARGARRGRDAAPRSRALNDELETALGRRGWRTAPASTPARWSPATRPPASGSSTGDAVNVAARLEQAAPENEVLIGEPTYRLVRDARRGRAGRAARAEGQGRARPRVPAARGRRTRRHRAARGSRPLVGREAELAHARRRARRRGRRRQRCRLVTVVGEAGVGKSRLVERVRRRASAPSARVAPRPLPAVRRRHHVLAAGRDRARGGRDRATRTRRTTRARSSRAWSAMPTVVERVAAAIGLADGDFPLHEIFWGGAQAARDARRRAAAGRARFDDIHWAEPTFLDLLEHLRDDHRRRAAAPRLLAPRPELLERAPTGRERRRRDASCSRRSATTTPAGSIEQPARRRSPCRTRCASGSSRRPRATRCSSSSWSRCSSTSGCSRWTRTAGGATATSRRARDAADDPGAAGRPPRPAGATSERAVIEPASVIGMGSCEPAVDELVPERRPAGGRRAPRRR